ncbi:MAG: DUF1573 domain-containing protein [Bacteroidales bacterium]|nr:DUF1573 domain-containing protein [Bacteroidales bacterium]
MDSSCVNLAYSPNAADNYVISLSGAEYVRFQHITISATGTDYSRVIVFINAANNDFINNRLIGASGLMVGSAANIAVVYSNGGSENSDNTFDNNLFQYGSYGLYFDFFEQTKGIIIGNNIFLDQYMGAIRVEELNAPVIDENYISSNSSYNYYNGIYCYNNNDNLSIQKNKIILTEIGGGTGIFLSSCYGTFTLKGLIANNFIAIIADNYSEGMLIDQCSYQQFIHNSVNVVGNFSYSYAMRIYSYSTNIEMYNNIFANNAYGYAIYCDPEGTSITSDYNDIYSSGSTLASYDNNLDDLTAWQTATGQDVHSISENPWYISDTDLHVFTVDLNGKATYINIVSDDIDGDVRNTISPDIGADEFTPPSTEIAVTEILKPENACGMGAEIVSVVLRNLGANPINGGIIASYTVEGSSSVVSEPENRTIASGDTIVHTFSTPADLSVVSSDSVFIILSYVDLAGDMHHENDSLRKEVYSGYIPPDPVIADVTIPAGDSAILTAVSNFPVLWYADTNSNVPITGGLSFTTPVLWDTTMFYADASNGVFDTLSTIFSGNTNGNGFMFNVGAKNNVVINGFVIHLAGTIIYDLEIYYRDGVYNGYQNRIDDWTRISSISITGAGAHNPTFIDIDGLSVPANSTYGFYIYCSNSYSVMCNYGSTSYSDDNLLISGGALFQAYFGLNYPSRIWNGAVHYETMGVCTSDRIAATVFVTGTPMMTLSGNCLDMDTAMIGATNTNTLFIYNLGTFPLEITNITNSTTLFSPDTNGIYVYPGDTGNLIVSFTPDAIGDFYDTMYLYSNAGDTSICLSGFGVYNSVLEIDPDSFNVVISQCNDSISLPLEIKNTGLGTLSYEFSGQYGFSYDSVSDIYYTSSGQNTTHIFSNLINEADTVLIIVYINGDYNAATEYATIFVDGTEIDVINPTTHTATEQYYFIGVNAASILADGIVTVIVDNSLAVNPGYGTQLNRVELIINGIPWINVSQKAGTVLPGDSTIINIEFNAKGMLAGTYIDQILLSSNDPSNPFVLKPCEMNINVSPSMSFSASCIAFDSIITNTSATDTLVIYNTCCDTLFLNNIFTSTVEFQVNESSLVIIPYDTADLLITFSPPSSGNYIDTLYLIGLGIDEKVCLSGIGGGVPVISIDPVLIDVTIFSCNDSITETLKIYNSGVVDLEYTITGYSGLNWIDIIPDNGTVALGDSSLINVKFRTAGNQSGLYSATLHILSNDPNNNDISVPCSLTIDGEPVITLSNYLMHFGNVIENVTKSLPLIINNDGCDTLKITAINTLTTEFSASAGPIQILPFGSAQINIDFTPSAQGSFFDTLFITSNDINVNIPLAGVGIGPPVININPDTFDIVIDNCNGVETEALYIINSGQGDLIYQFPDSTSWITISSQGGVVSGGNTNTIYVQFNSHGLTEDIYTSNIIITSNDPVSDTVIIPCTLDVRNNINQVLELGNDTTVCGSLLLEANSGFNDYIWQNGSTAQTFNALVTGTYYVTAYIDVCFKSDTINVTVNPVPVVSLTGLDSVYIINDPSVTITGSPPGGVFSGPGVTANIFDPALAGSGIHIITYAYTNIEGCTAIDTVFVKVLPIFDLDGRLTYKNIAESPLNNVAIYLKTPEGDLVDSLFTDALGDYLFNDIVYDEYQLECITTKPWGGANATDALAIQRHVVYLNPLTGLNLVAADVNDNNYVSSADALLVMLRFVGMVNSFAAGDWAFDNEIINLYQNTTYNFNGLCYGDVNGSFIPSSIRKEPLVELIIDGQRKIAPGKDIEIPLKLLNDHTIGSITLVINYPNELITVNSIYFKDDDLYYTIKDGEIRIAWSDTEALLFMKDEALILINAEINPSVTDEELDFSLGYESEISDPWATVIEGVKLKIPYLSTGEMNTSYYLSQNFPNPYSSKTTISYCLPEQGRVDLSIYNLLGEKVKSLVNTDQSAGVYEVIFDGASLTAGVYLYKIEVDGLTSTFVKTRIMNLKQ